MIGEPPGVLQEVRWCHQKDDPWLILYRKTRFGEWDRKKGRNGEEEMGRKSEVGS
jgi:hypothetical protein